MKIHNFKSVKITIESFDALNRHFIKTMYLLMTFNFLVSKIAIQYFEKSLKYDMSLVKVTNKVATFDRSIYRKFSLDDTELG